jgi:hypothetical protein
MLDPDPHSSKMLDPDPYPDPHITNADPKHCHQLPKKSNFFDKIDPNQQKGP